MNSTWHSVLSRACGCVDVMITKPVTIDAFNQLLESASTIHQTMDQIHRLGRVPLEAA